MRGSEDGFDMQTFLNKCKNKGKTVSIIKPIEGNVFGVYTDLDFDGSAQYRNGNKNTFLFAFINYQVIKCKCINSQDEIFSGNDTYIFDFGHESIILKKNCNAHSDNLCNELGKHFDQSILPSKYIAG